MQLTTEQAEGFARWIDFVQGQSSNTIFEIELVGNLFHAVATQDNAQGRKISEVWVPKFPTPRT
jgi:hypothetical protein